LLKIWEKYSVKLDQDLFLQQNDQPRHVLLINQGKAFGGRWHGGEVISGRQMGALSQKLTFQLPELVLKCNLLTGRRRVLQITPIFPVFHNHNLSLFSTTSLICDKAIVTSIQQSNHSFDRL